MTSARQVTAAGLLIVTSILGPVCVFSGLRVAGPADHVAYRVWPFPTTEVPDPDGVLERAGRPGPFLR